MGEEIARDEDFVSTLSEAGGVRVLRWAVRGLPTLLSVALSVGCGEDATDLGSLQDPFLCTLPGPPFTAAMLRSFLTRSAWGPTGHISGSRELEGKDFELRFGETRGARCVRDRTSFFIETAAFLNGDEEPIWSGWNEMIYVSRAEGWEAIPDPDTHQFRSITVSGGWIFSEDEIVYDLLFFPEGDVQGEERFASYRFEPLLE